MLRPTLQEAAEPGALVIVPDLQMLQVAPVELEAMARQDRLAA